MEDEYDTIIQLSYHDWRESKNNRTSAIADATSAPPSDPLTNIPVCSAERLYQSVPLRVSLVIDTRAPEYDLSRIRVTCCLKIPTARWLKHTAMSMLMCM